MIALSMTSLRFKAKLLRRSLISFKPSFHRGKKQRLSNRRQLMLLLTITMFGPRCCLQLPLMLGKANVSIKLQTYSSRLSPEIPRFCWLTVSSLTSIKSSITLGLTTPQAASRKQMKH